jgi:tetratricopeptide (TPR) repeat protein
MVEGLVSDKRRQATDAIRGYVYQAYQSVLAWMRLGEEEVLFLEGAEDFDVHSADGVTAIQVKDTAGSGTFTLRSGAAAAAINNLWRHQQNNQDRAVSLRFLTTALPGREQGGAFGAIPTGIAYWSLAKRDEELSVEPLKSFLLSLALEPSLTDFLHRSDGQTIRKDFICRLSWDTGCKPIDGLVAAIKDDLVCFGARKGIDSYQSEKVLDTLLRKVADLLCSDAERRLVYADFIRAFEQATMELVSREEAVTRRHTLGQIAQLAQSVTPSMLADLRIAPQVLGSPMHLTEGAAFRTDLVLELAGILRRNRVLFLRGSTGLGKTSLAQLLVGYIGNEWVWAGFRGRDPRQIADHLKRAAFELKASGVALQVVLDDLDLGLLAQFERELLSLVFSISNQGGAVVVTGPTACPADLLAKLWLPQDCDREVPYFTESDVRNVLVSHGLSDPQALAPWSHLIWLCTAGHPQLVHARVRNLQSQGWPPVLATNFLQTEDLEQVRTSARRRLTDEFPSEGAKYIAYRLSLITGDFSRQMVFDLAQLPPPVALPGDAFDGLVGPWIETLGNNTYRVSPLLSSAGNQVLSEPEQTAVHTAIAFGFLARRVMTSLEFGTALMHALIAKSDWALLLLARGALTFDHETSSAISDTIFWFPNMALGPGQHFLTQPAVDFIGRLAQFRIAAAGRQPDSALIIIERALEVLEQIEDEESATLEEGMAYVLFLSALDVPIPPRRSIPMLARLMELQESNEHLAETAKHFRYNEPPNIGFTGLSSCQALFTFEAQRIAGIDDLDELLDALSMLNDNKRQCLIEVFENGAKQLAPLLISVSWWKDASRDALNIPKALATFRKAINVGQAWSSPSLVRASYVAMAVIHDEYADAPDDALAILDEAVAVFGTADAYLLKQRAMVLFHQQKYEEAAASFVQALAGDGLDNVERAYAGRTGGLAAAYVNDWNAAERFFLLGASAAEKLTDFQSMVAGLKADAAFARWKQGRHADALRLYAEVLDLLEDIPIDENLQTRHVHATVRYCLGWIAMGARDTSYTTFREPLPGACSNPEPHESLPDHWPSDVSAVWGLLGNICTRLEVPLDLARRAQQKSNGALPLMARIMDRMAHYEALLDGRDLPTAVSIFIRMVEASICLNQAHEAQRDHWAPSDIPPLPNGYWEDQHTRAGLLLFLLAAGVLATCLYPDSPLPVNEWLHDMRLHDIAGSDVDHFFALLIGTETQTDGSLEEAVVALRRIREDASPLKELCVYHLRLWYALCSQRLGEPVGIALAKIVAAQWVKVSENQHFALVSPSLYAPMLKAKCEDTSRIGFSQVASILKIATAATGVRLAKNVAEFLTHVETGAESISSSV